MYAIIETGGKQYKVQEGDIIFVEKLEKNDGEQVVFDKVIAVAGDDGIKTGSPYVQATVEGTLLKNGKNKKITIIKYKSKKNEKKKQGHRQPYSKIQISKVAL